MNEAAVPRHVAARGHMPFNAGADLQLTVERLDLAQRQALGRQVDRRRRGRRPQGGTPLDAPGEPSAVRGEQCYVAGACDRSGPGALAPQETHVGSALARRAGRRTDTDHSAIPGTHRPRTIVRAIVQLNACEMSTVEFPDDGAQGSGFSVLPLARNHVPAGAAGLEVRVTFEREQLGLTTRPPAAGDLAAEGLGSAGRIAAAEAVRDAARKALRQRQDRDPPAAGVNAGHAGVASDVVTSLLCGDHTYHFEVLGPRLTFDRFDSPFRAHSHDANGIIQQELEIGQRHDRFGTQVA